jgi:FMN phosphatase YigB (HAD superfamily)
MKERSDLQNQLWPTVPLLPGVAKLVQHLKEHNIPMAIATGSRRSRYELKTGHHQGVFGLFEGKVVCGDDKQYNMRGKPSPDIFITAAREMLGRDVGNAQGEPTLAQVAERARGLVLEDGLPGIQGGKRAGMNGASFSTCLIMKGLTYLSLGHEHSRMGPRSQPFRGRWYSKRPRNPRSGYPLPRIFRPRTVGSATIFIIRKPVVCCSSYKCNVHLVIQEISYIIYSVNSS